MSSRRFLPDYPAAVREACSTIGDLFGPGPDRCVADHLLDALILLCSRPGNDPEVARLIDFVGQLFARTRAPLSALRSFGYHTGELQTAYFGRFRGGPSDV